MAMVVIVIVWSFAILTVAGVGVPVGRLLGLGPSTRLATSFWVGLAAVVGWLFLIHTMLPLDSYWVRLPIIIAGLVGWWSLLRASGSDTSRFKLPQRVSDWVIPAACLTVVAVIANLSLSQPGNYDSYFYHFASITHYSDYAAIEGLVNLHHRLGFQAATLPLASVLDLWPFDGEGFRLVNGLLGTALVFELGSRLRSGLEKGRFGLGDIVLGVSVPVLLLIPGAASPTGAIASPSLDTGAALLSLVGFAYFVDAVADRTGERFAVAVVVLCLAATFRQLNLVLLAFALPVLFILLWRAGNLDRRTVVGPLVLGGFVLFASALHSTVVSGYPFYPATFPSFSFSWAHPPAEAAEVREFISRFARGTLGGSVGDGAVLPWLPDWVAQLRQQGQLGRLQVLGLVSIASMVGILAIRNRRSGLQRLALLLIPLLPTLTFWFITAPLLRFGFGPIALVVSTPLALLIAAGCYEFDLRRLPPLRARIFINATAVVLMFLVAGLLMSSGKYGKQGSLLVSADGSGDFGSRAPSVIRVQATVVNGGVEIFRPTEETFCGFELWCTIETQFGLRLRGDSFPDGFERLETGETPAEGGAG